MLDLIISQANDYFAWNFSRIGACRAGCAENTNSAYALIACKFPRQTPEPGKSDRTGSGTVNAQTVKQNLIKSANHFRYYLDLASNDANYVAVLFDDPRSVRHARPNESLQLMPHLLFLGREVLLVVLPRRDADGDFLDDGQAVAFDAVYLLGVVGHDAQLSES